MVGRLERGAPCVHTSPGGSHITSGVTAKCRPPRAKLSASVSPPLRNGANGAHVTRFLQGLSEMRSLRSSTRSPAGRTECSLSSSCYCPLQRTAETPGG